MFDRYIVGDVVCDIALSLVKDALPGVKEIRIDLSGLIVKKMMISEV